MEAARLYAGVRRRRDLALALAVMFLVGCTAVAPSAPPSDSPATASAAAALSPSPTLGPSPSTAPPYEEVEFAAGGGPTLRGRVWSDGRIGIVLAHGYSPDSGQDDWNPFAEYLAGLGYGVLTFDFRGFCDQGGCSEGTIQVGQNWPDVVAAIEYLRSRRSERIFVVAASMGGINTFRAADEVELDLAGIVSLATPQFPSRYYDGFGDDLAKEDVTPERLQRIAAPKLFIAGEADVQSRFEIQLKPGVELVRFAEDARAMFETSPEPRQLEIVDSDQHSSSLLFDPWPSSTAAVAEAGRAVVAHTRALIVTFIEEHA